MGVELHIEELVLHGFAARDRHRIAAAVQAELSRLLAAAPPGSLRGPLALERANGGAFHIQANAKPQAAGTQIAQALFRTMRQQARASRSGAGQGGRKA